jgi:hypothetical protein
MTCKTPTCLSAEAPSSWNYKYEGVQVRTQHSLYYNNKKMLKTLEL